MSEKVTFTFLASLPPIQSAITFDGNGDGARIKLDLSRAECGAAVLLHQKGTGKTLKVTIEIVNSELNLSRELDLPSVKAYDDAT